MHRNLPLILILFCSSLLFSCNNTENEQASLLSIDDTITQNNRYSKLGKLRLSEYAFFEGKLKDLTPSDRLFKYELNTPLFTDYASKARFIFLPEKGRIGYREDLALSFPLGSILIKNFYYTSEDLVQNERKIIETRLLIHEADAWIALPYIWNKEQTEAFLEITGGDIQLEHTTKGKFSYSVPTMNQCKSCHESAGKITPIGPTVRQLNRDDQIDKLLEIQFLDSAPSKNLRPQLAQWDNKNAALEDRARAYLDINCAHCHQKDGPAKNSGLSLRYNEQDLFALGIKKRPVAAGKGSGGYSYDIDPGNAAESILLHRMMINDPGTRMPELGRNLVHEEGIELIREWIDEMFND